MPTEHASVEAEAAVLRLGVDLPREARVLTEPIPSHCRMSDILEAQKDYKKLKSQAAKEKLEALERSLGISAGQAAAALEGMDDEEPAEDGPSGSGSRSPTGGGDKAAVERKAAPKAKDLTKEDLAQLAGRKHKFDDSEFLEQSREINESVRGAVAAGASPILPARPAL
jgi:hypothetical protein